jgi:hypothetical protein
MSREIRNNYCAGLSHGGNVRLMALTKEAREFFVKQGRKGGRAYAKNSTPEQRKAAARHAAQARWAKARAKMENEKS